MTGLRLYARYASISVRGQLQCRASIAMQALGIFIITGTEFIGIWALFARFGTIRGWALPEVALFYGLISISWALCDSIARGFDIFHTLIKAGDFDRILLRPRSTVLQLLGHELTLRRVGRLAQGVAVLIYASTALDLSWSPAHLALLVATIAGAICVFLGLVIMQATMAFWTTESLEVWNAFTYGGVLMSQYPLAIYRSWFRDLFTYVIPLGCVNYFPGLALLDRSDPLGTPTLVHWLAPLAGPLFLSLALGLWQIGIRHYRSTGS